MLAAHGSVRDEQAMSVERVFLGWSRPALAAACEVLFERYARPRQWDLRRVVIVLPSARAARRLLELLVERAEQARCPMVPPRIVTVGALGDLLCDRDAPAAEDLARELAWIHALRTVDRDTLAPFAPDPPAPDDWTGWTLLAGVVDGLHVELAGHGIEFADVARRGLALDSFDDATRWMALAAVQVAYRSTLGTWGLGDPYEQRARSAEKGTSRAPGDVVLLGVVELPPVLGRLVDALEGSVTALIVAPDDLAHWFDARGELVVGPWTSAIVPLANAQIDVVDRPADQPVAVLDALASWSGTYAAHDIVVGIPDRALVPTLVDELGRAGIAPHDPEGTPMPRSRVYGLLEAVRAVLGDDGVSHVAALLRHVDVEFALRNPHDHEPATLASHDVISALDRWCVAHQVRHRVATAPGPDDRDGAIVHTLFATLDAWLAPFRSARLPLGAWAEPLFALLVTVLARRAFDAETPSDRRVLEACNLVRGLFESLAALPVEAQGVLDAPDMLRWVLRRLDALTLGPASTGASAIELLGWLDLPLDDARAAIVTSFNEGIVPSSVNADAFLPNTLRRHLGLVDNERRYARDAYALSVLLHSHEQVRVVSSRRSSAGDPMVPSRLLFATPAEEVPSRVLRFYSETVPLRPPSSAATPPPSVPREPCWVVPRPRSPLVPVKAMSVTSFRDYLACPYRYYLRHVEHLDTLDDTVLELDPAQFGSLAHKVLEAFGRSRERHSTDERAIRRVLDASLNERLANVYGDGAAPAVRIQAEQLRTRLHAFARWQAARAADGWRIAGVEQALRNAALTSGPYSMPVRGTIDRIDVNVNTGEWVILDYKTSDSARPPEKAHRSADVWVELQLPLYRHFADSLELDPPLAGKRTQLLPRTGYVTLARGDDGVRELLTDWDDDTYRDAVQCGRDVIAKVREGIFWPPTSPPPSFSESFSVICMDEQLVAGNQADTGDGS